MAYHTPVQQEKHFDDKRYQEIVHNSRYKYELIRPKGMSLMDYIYQLLGRFLEWFFGKFKNTAGVGKTAFYAIAIIIIAVALYFILKAQRSNVVSFGQFDKQNNPSFIIEDIKGINFQEKIKEAMDKKWYQQVVRLYYLYCLQVLDNMGSIKYSKHKTNHDYLYEIGNLEVKESFLFLTNFFEFAWYGKAHVEEWDINIIEQQFLTIQRHNRQS